MSEQAQEEVDAATAALLVELAFLLPRGTDVKTHPIAKAIARFKHAIETRAREGR